MSASLSVVEGKEVMESDSPWGFREKLVPLLETLLREGNREVGKAGRILQLLRISPGA